MECAGSDGFAQKILAASSGWLQNLECEIGSLCAPIRRACKPALFADCGLVGDRIGGLDCCLALPEG